MRKFSSYGPIDIEFNYYVPRQKLIDQATQELLGEDANKGGHYITVWAPRQAGKSWIMQQVLWRLWKDERFDTIKLDLEHLKMTEEVGRVFQVITSEITEILKLPDIKINGLEDFYTLFKPETLKKPLILIMDEFDALLPSAISGLVGVFRNIYNTRRDSSLPSAQKPYLLHGVALMGVRAVLGIENMTGSPKIVIGY